MSLDEPVLADDHARRAAIERAALSFGAKIIPVDLAEELPKYPRWLRWLTFLRILRGRGRLPS